MALPVSTGDVIVVTGLAWKTIQGARKACGEYDELTREVKNLYAVLRRLDSELKKPDGLLKHEPQLELRVLVTECERVLCTLDKILGKYNALNEQDKSGRKLWQRVRFGNGEMEDVQEQRARLRYYTSAVSLHLNLTTVGSQGRVEKQMEEAGGDIKEIQKGLNRITAELMSVKRHDGSVMTAYDDDEKAFWKDLRRGLVKEGFTSSKIGQHKDLIQAYVRELADRSVFDDHIENNPDTSFQENNRIEGNLSMCPLGNDHIRGTIHMLSKVDDCPENDLDILAQENDHIKGNIDISSQDLPPTSSSRQWFEDKNAFTHRRDAAPAMTYNLHHEKIGNGYSSKDGTRQERISTGSDCLPEQARANYETAYIEQNSELVPITEATEAELSRSQIFDLWGHAQVTPYPLPFSLEELYYGVDRQVFVRYRIGGCRVYKGFVIKIEPGCKIGTEIKFKEVRKHLSGPEGQDIDFIVYQKPHPVFRRDGNDLIATISLAVEEEECPWEITLLAFDGGAEIIVSELCAEQLYGPMFLKVFPGRGMPDPSHHSWNLRGDLCVFIDVC